jgi:hypothetical protein
MDLALSKLNLFCVIHRESVLTSQETQYIFAATIKWFMLFAERVAVYSENHTEHMHYSLGQSTEFNMLKQVVQLGCKWLVGARQGRECAENLKYTEL